MKDNFLKIIEKYKVFVLFFIILMQVLFITYVFATQKNGFHSDEAWSYGFANSYYVPYIYKEGNSNPHQVEKLTNFGEWISGDVFWDYIVVNDGERFAYDSVYYNKEYDQSPPLYCMLLHTICSLFPNSFSLWYGFAINIFLFIWIQVLVYLLTRKLSKSGCLGLITCLFYGFTTAALGTVVYLRMYALLTAITMLYLLMNKCMSEKGYLHIGKESIVVVLCIALGGFTQYFFYVFAFFMTLYTCVCLFLRKKYKLMFKYGGISALGALIGLLLYPTAIKSILDGTSLYEYSINLPFWTDVEYCLDILSQNTLGMDWYIDRFLISEFVFFLFLAFSILVMLFILFRNEKWFLGIKEKVHDILEWVKEVGKNKLYNCLSKSDVFFVCSILTLFSSLMVISRIVNVWGMFSWCDRYLFYLMPLWCIIVITGMFWFLETILKFLINTKNRDRSNGLSYGIIIILLFADLLIPMQFGKSHYLFKEYYTDVLTNLVDGADCILVINSDWALEWYSAELYKASGVYVVYSADIEGTMKKINLHEHDKRRYLVLAENAFISESDGQKEENATAWMNTTNSNMTINEFIDYFMDEYNGGNGSVEYIYDQKSISGELKVYEIK